ASTDLIVQCNACSAFWGVKKRAFMRPDLIWVELWPRFPWSRIALRKLAIGFDASQAYQRPDPLTIDWSLIFGPRKPNGMCWHQVEFSEMHGTGDEQCVSSTQLGISRFGVTTVM